MLVRPTSLLLILTLISSALKLFSIPLPLNGLLNELSIPGSNLVNVNTPTNITFTLPAELGANPSLSTGGLGADSHPALAQISVQNGEMTVQVDLSTLSEAECEALRKNGFLLFYLTLTDSDNSIFFGSLKLQLDPLSSSSKTAPETDLTNANLKDNADASVDNGGTSTTGDLADPISTSNREFFFYNRWLDLNGSTLPLTFELQHGSRLAELLFFDFLPVDFLSNHHLFARKTDLFDGFFFQLQFHLGLGKYVTYIREFGETDWTLSPGQRWKFEVVETTDAYYLKDPGTQKVWIFDKFPVGTDIEPAYCRQIIDRNGNTLTYEYTYGDPDNIGPSSVTDSLGRTLTFDYQQADNLILDSSLYLKNVTDHTGRQLTFDHEEVDGRVQLTQITDPLSGTYQYSYDDKGYLTGITKPEGNTPFTQTFEELNDNFFSAVGAVTSQTDAYGHTTTFEQKNGLSGLGAKHTLITNPDGSERRHFHSDGNILSAIIDEKGAVSTFETDDQHDTFASYCDRDGESGSFTYRQDSGHLLSETDSKGSTTTYTYTESSPQTFTHPDTAETVQFTFLDLTRIDYADNTFRTFTYDPSGNRLTATNREAETTTVTYNSRGQALTRTNPESGVTTFTYDPTSGNLATATDSDTGVTTLTYDTLSRLTTITNPDSTTQTFTYDALDRLITATDEDNILTRFSYDSNSNLTSVTRAEGTPEEQIRSYEFDLRDRLLKTIDPFGSETSYTYDYHEKPITVTQPDGEIINLSYDKRRQLTSLTDELGESLSFTRTPSELIASITTPENRRIQYTRDPLGQILSTTDSSDDTSSLQRDVFSRPTQTSDALQRITQITRDGEGRITQRTEPTIGNTLYQYDDNGRLTKLTDTRNNEWNFTFTSMGRRQSISDPQNHSETRSYDNRGRLRTIIHPDSITETRAYHPDNRLQSRTFSDGLTHSFTYDPLNRLTQTTRALSGQTDTCIYEYDSRSNFTSTTVNGNTSTATYDTRNRLTTLTYPGGFAVTYIYNARSELTRISDSLGNSIDFTYSKDRQLLTSTRSNGRVTTLTYDVEGLIETLAHDTGGSLTATFNPADELTSLTRTGFPADGSTSLNDSTDTFTYNENSELTNGGFTYDDRGRPNNCTWDSDNRLIAVNNGTPVTYRYDANGQLTSRTESGTTTEYLYNAALRTNPIIGEKENSTFTRYYITLPNGQILYHLDDPSGTPAIFFHHHGQTGNTRFLTDSSGAITDSYAYDAYGRLLEKNGSSTQFYQYVGRLGVRTDAAANLVQMRQRYYDPSQSRFLSRDPIFLSLMTRAGLEANPYHYTGGRPSFRTDSSGLNDDFDELSNLSDEDWEEWRDSNYGEMGDDELFPRYENGAPAFAVSLNPFAFLIRHGLDWKGQYSDDEEYSYVYHWIYEGGLDNQPDDTIALFIQQLDEADRVQGLLEPPAFLSKQFKPLKQAEQTRVSRRFKNYIQNNLTSAKQKDCNASNFARNSATDQLPPSAQGDTLFEDGFESDNTSQWK